MSYAVLDDLDQDPEESERCGELTLGGEYAFCGGRLMGCFDGCWILAIGLIRP